MIEVEALVVQEPVSPRVEVVGIAEPLDRERQPPRQTDVVVVPWGDELAACQTSGGVLFVAYKGRDSLLEEVLVVRGTVICGADAADRWQAHFWSGACVCEPAGDASVRAAAGLHSL
jgi:hypothetical protein